MKKDSQTIAVQSEEITIQEIPVKLPQICYIDKNGASAKRVVIQISNFQFTRQTVQDLFRSKQIIALLKDINYQEILPSAIVFLDQAVKLLEISELIEILNKLSEQKIEIYVSKVALEEFQIEKKPLRNFLVATYHEINAVLLAADLIVPY